MPKKRKVIDLFCGAGGFSLGAHFAGFDTALAVDIDARLTSSFCENFPEAKLLCHNLSEVSGDFLLREANLKRAEVCGIIGGPPCQGFSLMGRRELNDPRNELVGHFFRLVHEIRPTFFLLENVPGILFPKPRRVLDDLINSLSGYEVLGPLQVNASDFGAATNRPRVIVIGFREGRIDQSIIDMNSAVVKKSSVRSAIFDLPEPTIAGWGEYRTVLSLSSYALRARKLYESLGSAPYKEAMRAGRLSGLKSTLHTAQVRQRLSSVLPGKNDSVSKCPRLAWDSLAPTLRAGTGPELGSFQSIRPIHPEQNRVITVREAARLQGFPDWFKFHETKWHSFRMIGNSLSPFMSEALLRAISSQF